MSSPKFKKANIPKTPKFVRPEIKTTVFNKPEAFSHVTKVVKQVIKGPEGRPGLMGRPGENGQHGRDGKDGHTPTIEEIRPIVEDVVKKHPVMTRVGGGASGIEVNNTPRVRKISFTGATVSRTGDGVNVTISDASGDVDGPVSATDNAIARFDGTGGKAIQNSVVTIADTTGNMAGVGTLNTHTIPGGTDTLVGRATTDTLTNKTIDADGTGNSITNIENADIKAAAAIAVNKLAALTVSELVVTDGSGFLTTSAGVSATEAGYLNGVTSAIQTQIDTKAPIASPTFTGTVTLPVGLTGVIRTDTGVVSVDSDVTDIVTAASLTAAGKVELATTAEINTGTDTIRAIPVDQYVASNRNVRFIFIRVVENATDVAVATTKGGDFELPFTGTITEIGAYVDTAGTTGTMTVDVNLNGTTLMTTNKITIDTAEKSSRTAATAPALTTTAVTAGDLITVDIDAIHTTAAKGLTIRLGIRYT